MSHITYLEASVVGLIQGVTELFPVSSLGHNVLIPALIGGSWASDLNVAAPESPYLAYIVGLHVATALAMMIYFWRDWIRIIGGFFSSIRDREIRTVDQKLAWMIILATIPVGLVGAVGQKEFQALFAKPVRAAIFLIINGLILFAGEKFRTRKSLAADAQLAAAEAGTADTRPVGRPAPARAMGDDPGVGAAGSGAGGAGRRERPERASPVRSPPCAAPRPAAPRSTPQRTPPASGPPGNWRPPGPSRPTRASPRWATCRRSSSGRRRSSRCW